MTSVLPFYEGPFFPPFRDEHQLFLLFFTFLIKHGLLRAPALSEPANLASALLFFFLLWWIAEEFSSFS